ncbi:hypothetical protein FA95DRAFT_1552353 [Auriscalpium vulgare]|uniref:Uncharacterized protein n=1 Tax=Auriscalpium vulgare TaxID=40419 RepID=A0ACB8SAG6_9AGAM|nr:hypothetical protein FA95DRAFT_1552353 [Auriscalpium vulgare]
MSMRSTTSTSRRPMSPTSVYEDVWDMSRVPPTTNELDAEEKRRRLKKARKLSQILGELPTEYGDEEKRDAGAADVGGPGVKASKRLSWSAIQVTGHPLSADIAHPLSTRPSLHLLTRTMSSRSPHASTRPTPTLSPVVDARTSSHFTRPSLDASVRSMPSSERGLESASRVSSSSQRSESRRRNGRPARATRPHDVPDLPSPVPGALSPLDGPSDPWEPPVSPRSPLANDKWRRKSMDASSARSSVHSSKASAHGEAPSVKPRRSKSLWSKKSGKSEGSEEGTGAVESEEAFRSGPISGKQRSLSVRRGRKLAQVR